MAEKNSSGLALNATLGFLSLLLGILLFALATRVIYPRVYNQRAGESSLLIGKTIQIEVLNGCGVAGLATSFTNSLIDNGFDVVESGNFETFDISETMVIDRSGNMENARRVAQALGVAEQNIIHEISPDYFLDATVVIGSDYKKMKVTQR